jgi:murein DD-endopeptidase MepM/ murein hydrolase activator NlpD
MNNIKSNSQLKQKKNIKKIKFNIKEHNNTYSNIKTINLIWPIKKPVLFRYFNSNKKNIYNGIALGAPSGTKVFAALYGKVLYTGKQFNCFGNIIILQHSDFLVTIYGNLSHIYVQSGMNIQQNQSIGIVGCTGNVESPRIHFEVRYHGYPIDPLILLKKMQ